MTAIPAADVPVNQAGLPFNHAEQDSMNSSDDDGSSVMITVGKIAYNTKDLLGRGCEGTAVYK